MQFLVEAFVLALLGGVIGIALGLGIAGAAAYGMQIPFAPSLSIIALSFAFSGAIGVVFGFFPARRAARLDPVAVDGDDDPVAGRLGDVQHRLRLRGIWSRNQTQALHRSTSNLPSRGGEPGWGTRWHTVGSDTGAGELPGPAA